MVAFFVCFDSFSEVIYNQEICRLVRLIQLLVMIVRRKFVLDGWWTEVNDDVLFFRGLFLDRQRHHCSKVHCVATAIIFAVPFKLVLLLHGLWRIGFVGWLHNLFCFVPIRLFKGKFGFTCCVCKLARSFVRFFFLFTLEQLFRCFFYCRFDRLLWRFADNSWNLLFVDYLALDLAVSFQKRFHLLLHNWHLKDLSNWWSFGRIFLEYLIDQWYQFCAVCQLLRDWRRILSHNLIYKT